MKKLQPLSLLIISILLLASLPLFILAQTASGNKLTIQLNNIGGGQSSLTNEKTLISPYSAKLVIPSVAPECSGCIALYPYNNTLNSINSFMIVTSYTNATPRFVIFLDKNNDGEADLALVSDYQFTSNGNWQTTQGGNRWGWSEAGLQLSTYGKTWNTLDYWKNQYGNTQVLFVGVALEYWAVKDSGGLNQPLYSDALILNGITYSIIAATNPNSVLMGFQTTNIVLDTRLGGQASITNESLHTDPYSIKLVIPSNMVHDPCVMALYPYNKSFSTLDSFSVWASFTLAVPRFVIYLDSNIDGTTDSILLSDYQFVSNGQWEITTGGQRWGWSQTNYQINSYGKNWNQFDYWKNLYGNYTVLYVGICLEYWAVYDRNGCDLPLYADEAIINGVTYNLTATANPTLINTPATLNLTPPATSPTTIVPTPTVKPSPVSTPKPIAKPNDILTPQPIQKSITQPTATPSPTYAAPQRALTEDQNENLPENWILLTAIIITAIIAIISLTFIFRKNKNSEN